MSRIEELLEQRQALVETAALIYGDMYIIDDNFWKSSIEEDMYEIESELMDLGYEEPEVSPEMEAAAWLLLEALQKGGIIPNKEEKEEEGGEDVQ